MIHFLQKRKFRLIVRWRVALKQNTGFQLPTPAPFPYGLIFRAFQEIIRQLKNLDTPELLAAGEPVLTGLPAEATPTPDQYMEMFLTGRDVLDEFIRTDPGFCATFSITERATLRDALVRAVKELVPREMRAYAQRFPGPVHAGPAARAR